MKEKWVVIMLFSLILPLTINVASAADPLNQTDQSYQDLSENTKTTTQQNTLGKNDSQEITVIKKITTVKTGTVIKTNTTTRFGKAAGETTTTTKAAAITVTNSQLFDTANNVKNYVEKNKKLPSYMTIAGTQINMAQYLKLLNQCILNINKGINTPLVIDDVSNPTSPSETVKSGSISKSEYIKLAQNVQNFMKANGRAPNYVSSSLGKIRFESLVYTYSKIIHFYDTSNRLPNYVSVTSWTSQEGGNTNTDLSLQKYLVATQNCQSTSTTIKNLAASITNGKTSTYAKAQAIFNWVRDNLSYSFYYNSKKGALGALSSRSANCCDHSHLVNALARAAGIPGRYIHVSGHVYSQLYVNGVWYNADAIHNINYFGQPKSSKIIAIYASLPF